MRITCMGISDRTEKFGLGNPTTVEAPAVTCPACEETVFTETIGEVTCDPCENDFHAINHAGGTCPAVECGTCGTEIPFIKENRTQIVDWETYTGVYYVRVRYWSLMTISRYRINRLSRGGQIQGSGSRLDSRAFWWNSGLLG